MYSDTIISLACSMYAKKGIYALLLGSGISRSANIPTGWEITLDLIKKIAGDDIAEPEGWYKATYHKSPNYSEIIGLVGKTQFERNAILKNYFIRQEGESEKSKTPTEAHKAIAYLMKNEYIKVVITTNFDRLLEQALEQEGIIPTIISNVDQLIGACPLVHSDYIILKLHGDYMDARIKNTEKELEEYEPEINDYLDRILDEFGLIVCGWSGEWDIALRKRIERCQSYRFTTYWLQHGILSDCTKKLITHRKAEVIKIDSADQFFCDLKTKICSLTDLSLRNQTMNIELACATLKRWIEEEKIIRIRDLIIDEAKRVMNECDRLNNIDDPDISNTMNHIIEMLINLIPILCYWTGNKYSQIIADTLQVLTRYKDGYKWIYYYPARVYIFSVIISCLRSENYELLCTIMNYKFSERPGYWDVDFKKPISTILFKQLYKYDNMFFNLIKKSISWIVSDETDFNELYDKAYCFDVLYYKYICNDATEHWVNKHNVYKEFEDLFCAEISAGDSHRMFKSGLFGGDSRKIKEYLPHLICSNPFNLCV